MELRHRPAAPACQVYGVECRLISGAEQRIHLGILLGLSACHPLLMKGPYWSAAIAPVMKFECRSRFPASPLPVAG